MREIIKKVWNSRIGLAVIMFIAGGFVTHLFTPEKIRTEIKKEIEYVDRIVEKEVVKWKTKEIVKEVEIKKTKLKITKPDGTIIETEVYEENSAQIERIKEDYAEKLALKEQELKDKYSKLKEKINPKRFNLFGGVGGSVLKFKTNYLIGVNTGVYGPFTVGVIVTSDFKTEAGVYGTVGIKF